MASICRVLSILGYFDRTPILVNGTGETDLGSRTGDGKLTACSIERKSKRIGGAVRVREVFKLDLSQAINRGRGFRHGERVIHLNSKRSSSESLVKSSGYSKCEC